MFPCLSFFVELEKVRTEYCTPCMLRPRSHRNKPLWACYRWRSAGLRDPCDTVTPDLECKAGMACFSYPPNFEYLETHQCLQETGEQNVRDLKLYCSSVQF